MFVLAISAALADDLPFTDFQVSASGEAVEVTYRLAPSTWSAIQRRANGEPPKVMVTIQKLGTRYNQLVHLDEASKSVRFGSGEWPAGSSILIELHPWGAGEFDSLVVSGTRGRWMYLPLAGGTSRLEAVRPDRRPLEMPTGQRARPQPSAAATPTPSPSGTVTTRASANVSTVDPAAVIGSIALAVRQEQERRRQEEQNALYAQQRREAEAWAREQAARAEEDRRAFTEEILSTPDHPLSVACTEVFGTGNDRRCVDVTAYRDNGPAEVRACGRFDSGDTRWGCIDRLPQSTFVPEPIIHACADVFGTGPDALTCMDRARDHRSLPETDIRACGLLGNLEARLFCIPYFSAITYDPTELIDSCLEVQPDTAFDCMNQVLQPGFAAHPSLLGVCEGLRGNPDTHKACLALSKRPYGAEEARACSRLGKAGWQVDCMKLGRQATYLPHYNTDACVDTMGTGVDAMRCFKTVLEAPTPPAADIRSCGAVLEHPADTLACIDRFLTIEWSPDEVLGACKEHLPQSVLPCVKKIASGAHTPLPDLIGACGTAASDDEVALACIALMNREERGEPAAAVTACAGITAQPDDLLACIKNAKGAPYPEAIRACGTEQTPLDCVRDLR